MGDTRINIDSSGNIDNSPRIFDGHGATGDVKVVKKSSVWSMKIWSSNKGEINVNKGSLIDFINSKKRQER